MNVPRVLLQAALLAAAIAAGQPAPPRMPAAPKPGVCPLPVLPALADAADKSFYAPQTNPAARGTVVQPIYQNYKEADKRLHVYLPPGYKDSGTVRYPVLYLNHGGGDDDSAWIEKGSANAILDQLIAAGKARPMIVVMPNTKGCVSAKPPAKDAASGKLQDDDCTQEFVKDIIPFVDATYRTRADRKSRALAGLSMGGFVVLHTGLPHLNDLFSELYVYSSGHIGEEGLKQFQDAFGALIHEPDFNSRFRVPLYFAAGETDIALRNGQRVLGEFNRAGVRNFWVLSSGGHEWMNWRRYLQQTAQMMFPPGCD